MRIRETAGKGGTRRRHRTGLYAREREKDALTIRIETEKPVFLLLVGGDVAEEGAQLKLQTKLARHEWW